MLPAPKSISPAAIPATSSVATPKSSATARAPVHGRRTWLAGSAHTATAPATGSASIQLKMADSPTTQFLYLNPGILNPTRPPHKGARNQRPRKELSTSENVKIKVGEGLGWSF